MVKQVNDVHTPVLNQMMVYEYIKNYDYDGHIAACAKEYGKKCALMIEEMEKHFPSSVKFYASGRRYLYSLHHAGRC